MPQMSTANTQRLRKLRAKIAKLPVAEQTLWQQRVKSQLRAGPAVGADDGDHPAPDINLQFKEWDLELANWLDGAYGIVSDRVAEVARKGADAASEAGFSLWPLVAAAAVLFYLSKNR